MLHNEGTLMIIGCSAGKDMGKLLAKHLKSPYSALDVERFPDNELQLRFLVPVKDKHVILVQTFHHDIDAQLIEVLFAAQTAKDLGAKKVTLVAPYFPYLRQDKRFRPGDCVSQQVIAKLIALDVDALYTVDPHLHRIHSLKKIFDIETHRVTADPLIAEYIKHKIKNPLIIGPDAESFQWARTTAKIIGCEAAIMEKTRYSARLVHSVLNKEVDLAGKTVVMVDDIISTGHTLLEAIKNVRKLGAEKIVCIGVHAVFAENALRKLKRAGATVITSNTIPNLTAKIDVSGEIAKALKQR